MKQITTNWWYPCTFHATMRPNSKLRFRFQQVSILWIVSLHISNKSISLCHLRCLFLSGPQFVCIFVHCAGAGACSVFFSLLSCVVIEGIPISMLFTLNGCKSSDLLKFRTAKAKPKTTLNKHNLNSNFRILCDSHEQEITISSVLLLNVFFSGSSTTNDAMQQHGTRAKRKKEIKSTPKL